MVMAVMFCGSNVETVESVEPRGGSWGFDILTVIKCPSLEFLRDGVVFQIIGLSTSSHIVLLSCTPNSFIILSGNMSSGKKMLLPFQTYIIDCISCVHHKYNILEDDVPHPLSLLLLFGLKQLTNNFSIIHQKQNIKMKIMNEVNWCTY